MRQGTRSLMIASVTGSQVTHATANFTQTRVRCIATCGYATQRDRRHRCPTGIDSPTVDPMTECVFCGIIEGDLPAMIVFETEDVVAFLDTRPIARGQIVVVPKVHAADLDSLEPALGAALFAAGHRLSRALRRSDLSTDGANLVVNDGRAAFQTVFHTHLHVVPRWTGDTLRFARGFVCRRLRKPEEAAEAIREGIVRLSREGGT